jgi:4-azaleucine resistance transporter AzlC
MTKFRPGIRAGLPLLPAVFLVGMSFGVVAQPVMGSVAPIVMSAIVHAGAAQFAALAALAAGAAAPAAILAGLLMNLRFLAMGFAVAPSLRGGPLVRVLKGQTVVDASFAIGNRGAGEFDEGRVVGATLPQAVGWIGGTAVGVFAGSLLGDPRTIGLDAVFPAFFLALLVAELRQGRALVVALLASAVTLALIPVVTPGIPVLAASVATLLGLTGGAAREIETARADAAAAEAARA